MKGMLYISVVLLVALSGVPASFEVNELTPENTFILSNQTDESFCKDFSVFLKRLRPEWIIIDKSVIPEPLKDENLIIIGGLDAEYTGSIIQEIITEEEIAYIKEGTYAVFKKESPWSNNRLVYICTGSNSISTKKAAEEAILSLEGEWLYPPFSCVTSEEALQFIAEIQHIPDDEELPQDVLGVHVDAKPPSRVSREEAAEDVEYLFYLFSHGYCGYGYFQTRGDFEEAKKNILKELEVQPQWSPDDLSDLIYENLAFVDDCHLRVGAYKYGDHEEFWYDTSIELQKISGEYYFTSDSTYRVVSINGKHPDPYMFPSLNASGDPLYRIGMLSHSRPEPLVLTASDGKEETQIEIELHSSDFAYFSNDIFLEDRIGGIPVVRIRSFSDHHVEFLDQFISTAQKYRGEPCLIIDIRGNGGGNEEWPKKWIRRFTGQQPSNNRYFTEFISKTTMMGRANYFESLLDMFPDTSKYKVDMDSFRAQADFFEMYSMEPHWSGPFSDDIHVIPNDTTIIVLVNGYVTSAAEGFLIYLQQVENVILVGENSGGALVFGQMTLHQLPHSKIFCNLPISLNIPLDLVLREEKGFFPDLWIPAEDALNYVVAAIRKGTISTINPLPDRVLQEEFVPEKRSVWESILEPVILIFFTALFGIVFVFLNRKRNKLFFFIAGICWAAVGVIILVLLSPLGYAYSTLGIVCITVSVYKWRKEKASEN
ncbi:MAG: hypothetical protein HXS44_01600 [Theionarchaea archaeon]|nr:hypothetical protein [Theionarchaea archaeon]